MGLKFSRRQASVVSDWRQAPEVVQARARLAALEAAIPQAQERVKNLHTTAVANEEKALLRMEMEALEGRATDAQLAAAQEKHLNARRAQAREIFLVEDMQKEQAEVQATLPGIEKAARALVHADLRRKAVVVLKELQGHLEAAVQCEGELALLRREAEQQFDGNIRQERLRREIEPNRYEMVPNPGYDPDCEPHAAIPSFVHVHFDQLARMTYSDNIESRNANTLRMIDDALKNLDATA